MIRKERLDILLAEKGLCSSREQAQRCILAGEVWQGQVRLEKPGVKIAVDTPIELRSRLPKFVSRGGFKLEHGLETFGISVQDRVCIDVGASTGGFTDCLLQRGARRVIAVDVGTAQLDQKLRGHAQVTSLEQVNVRHLTAEALLAADALAPEITFVCADVSFISLALRIEPILRSAPKAYDWL
ncbi:TlyA family rRNA (cytidine-2'-O)-methyltransferase, partial [bacterium]|nr:TlyA family rRNA (cytidine-2'-O)-methyltransferase [bacterium]